MKYKIIGISEQNILFRDILKILINNKLTPDIAKAAVVDVVIRAIERNPKNTRAIVEYACKTAHESCIIPIVREACKTFPELSPDIAFGAVKAGKLINPTIHQDIFWVAPSFDTTRFYLREILSAITEARNLPRD
jgi:hypothetical protein